jgi:dihydrofolate reductase
MGRLVLNENLSLDGVMQGAGGPDEDRSGGFERGGWPRPYFDEVMGMTASEGMGSTGGLLLGRKTYEIFAASWPKQPADDMFARFLNSIPKYVASTTLQEPLEWENSSVVKGDVPAETGRLKDRAEKDLLVLGSGDLAQTLMEHGLVDEYQLWVHPLVLGSGKRLFREGSRHASLKLVDSKTSSTGVLLLTYHPT